MNRAFPERVEDCVAKCIGVRRGPVPSVLNASRSVRERGVIRGESPTRR